MSVLRKHDLANLDRELQMALGVFVESLGGGPRMLEEWLEAVHLADPNMSEEMLRKGARELIAGGYVRHISAADAQLYQATNAGMDAAIGYGYLKLPPAERSAG